MKTLINKIDERRVTLCRGLLLGISVMILTYLYFVNSTAFNAAAHERMMAEILEVQSEIGELELAYIEKSGAITKEMGAEFDLIEVASTETVFAVRASSEKLSLNE